MKDIQKIKDLIAQMTLDEKSSFCSGRDFWHLKGLERLSIPTVMVTDGPHGLRKQQGDPSQIGLVDTVPATCFPTASALAATWNRELIYEVGRALAEECKEEKVGVILGPGANIKRSPLCGRNFEYFSEDPYLSGELAKNYINGVQSLGIGTSLKHFAVNNQEYRRMSIDALVDERALREIYLAGFEIAVRGAQPWPTSGLKL
ncbi:MAG: glycoside hydrolase family 3 N-terminal domain-containing protein [Anaerolineales bacterium]